MPIMMLPNSGIDSAVSRPVTLDIAEQVMEILQIPQDTRIVFKGDSDSVYQSGSLITDLKDPTRNGNVEHVKTAANSQLTIEVVEKLVEEALGTFAVNQPEHMPFFHDSTLGISAKLVYIPSEVTISFKYKARSKIMAEKIRHDTWARVSNMRDVNVHTVTYHVPISDAFIGVIRYLHALRENVEGYGEDFLDYFLSNASPSLTQVSRLNGKQPTYTLQETATRILGMFDFTGSMEKSEKDSEGSTYNLEFTYKFTYEKPSNQVLKFPIAIHNQLVDRRLVDHDTVDLSKKKKFYSSSIKVMRDWEVDNILDQVVKPKKPIYVPSYDDILYDNSLPGTRTIFSAICSVDDNDPSLLLNLNDLGDYLFDEEVLDYIKNVEWKYITLPFQSLLNISHYRNTFLSDFTKLTLDSDLNLRATTPLNKRVINRIRVSLPVNVTRVDPKAIRRLLKYPNILRKLILATETNRVHLERLRPMVDITHLFKDLPDIGSPRSLFDTNRVQNNTVLTSGTAATEKSNMVRGKNVKLYNQIYGRHRS